MSAKKRIVIAGGSGLIGRHLRTIASRAGAEVQVLSRHPNGREGSIGWDPQEEVCHSSNQPLVECLDTTDVLINLAGESIGAGRLDVAHLRNVLDSRLRATRLLADAWRAADTPPEVWFQASAVGYYGDRSDDQLSDGDPDSAAGKGLLAEVCSQWEAAASAQFEDRGPKRIVLGRIGMVLADDAPSWDRMLAPVRYGVGGRLGSGDQWWSWVDANDLARAVLFLCETPDAKGAYNLTAPTPIRQADFVRAVARRLHRPAFVPTPAPVLRLVLGRLADELILASCRALPDRLTEAGFEFACPDLPAELDALLPL